MPLALVFSRGSNGIEAPLISIEVHISGGLPQFSIVGLPETAVRESRDRVRSALINANFDFPYRRITVSLAPAELPKTGSRFDLPIALGILIASSQLHIDAHQLQDYEFAGELALSGELRSISAVLPFALATQKSQRTLILPAENNAEAQLIDDLNVLSARHLKDVYNHLSGAEKLSSQKIITSVTSKFYPDLSDVRGQAMARRVLEIAAAGGHSLLMIGTPGAGKTMLASRLPGLLPELNAQQAVEVAAIYSVSSVGFHVEQWCTRPFRAPHHTTSSAALVGGGNPPRPGEISLAHHGVLFLDELPEFSRHVLEALREPLESGWIHLSRAARTAEYPAAFQLVAAMNPCPCGYFQDGSMRCECSHEQIRRYRARISGPLLDRIDLQIEVPALPKHLLLQQQTSESSDMVRQRVILARTIQQQRQNIANALLRGKALDQFCELSPASRALLNQAANQLNVSARGLHRLIRVARTIADLAQNKDIEAEHLSEALGYRLISQIS